jgi:hypothetical protein
MTEQKSEHKQQVKYQVVWPNLPQPVRQAVIAQLVKLLQKHLPVQAETPQRIRLEGHHD